MNDTATSPATPDPRPGAAAEIDRLSMLLLGRLSSKRPPKKAPSQRDVTADVGRIVNRSGGGAEWGARVAAALEALHVTGLIERRPLRLTDAGVEALRRSFGVARAPTWDELPALLAARTLGLDPEAPEARAAVRSTENLSALILARRFGIDERRGMGGVIDELTARELGVPSKGLNTDRLRARVLARHLGLPEKASVEQFIDGLINERLGLPPGKIDWVKLRKAVLARTGGTTTTGEPVQVATRIAAATVRVPKPEKRSMLAGLAQRWLDGISLADEGAAPSPAPAAASPAPGGSNGQSAARPATDPQAFARAVRAAAAEVTGEGRFGDRRVFIAALWRRAARGDLTDLTLAEFKQRLLDANRAGDLSLARADLVDAMDPALVAESEIRDLGSSFHFVLDEPRSIPAGGNPMTDGLRLDNTRLHTDLTHIHAVLTRLAGGARGSELARRAREVADNKLALPAVIGLALRADCMRVIHAAANADGQVTDQEVEALHDFLYSTARQYASARGPYARLHPLDDESAREFLDAYARDDGAFGHRNRATTWFGLDLCRRAAALGEPDAYDRYERMILRLCDESIRIGGFDPADPRGRARLSEIQTLRAELASDGRGAAPPPEVDQRLAAFLTGRRVFTSTEQAASVFEDDPFDVPSVHESARTTFERLVEQAITPLQHHDRGRMMLVLGDSGAGKTHLLRAFRGLVHDRAIGFCVYAQLQSRATDYARYLLSHVIDSLERPYASGLHETGLFELSSGPVRMLGERFLTRIADLREGTWADPDALADYVNSLADGLLDQPELSRFDPDLLRALLYVQRREPKITSRVLKYLRCEDMNRHDRRWLGDIVPRTGADDASRMIQQLAQLAFATQGAAFVILVDQAEMAGFSDEASTSFRRAISCLQNVTTSVPSAIAVIACLDNLYETTRPGLVRAAIDRLENDPPLERLATNRSYDEIEAIVAHRLKWLYDSMGTSFRAENPIYPFAVDRLRAHANRRARDVLDYCHRVQEASTAAGRFTEAAEGATGIDTAPRHDDEIDRIAASWNDALHRPGIEVPDDEAALLELLARAARACAEEVDLLEARAAAHRDRLEVDVSIGTRRAELVIAVAQSGYQGGAFARQVKALREAATLTSRAPVVVRTYDFPSGSKSDDLLAEHLRTGGRKLVVPETALRALLVLDAFASSHAAGPIARWRRRDQPIASLPPIRQLFDLDALLPVGLPSDGPIHKDTERDMVPLVLETVAPPLVEETTSPAANVREGEPISLGEAAGFAGRPVSTPPSMFTRHVAVLGSPGSGKTTLALNVIEQLVERGASAVLVDRKGDLAGYARPGWWTAIADPDRRRRAEALAHAIDVRLFTPGNGGGRPLSFGVVPHLDGVPVTERQKMIQYATSALASMMRLRTGASDSALRAILAQAITVLAERRAPASLDQLVAMVAERDDQLVARASRYDDRLFARLVMALETLRLSEAELFDPTAETLSGELLLGRADGGRIPVSIVSTRFLGDVDRVQAWVAQLLVELYRWCGKAPATELATVLLLDEADLYAPAGMGNPPSKGPLQDLIRRSRAAGLGVILASQSPADFDYRLRDLVSTWLVGRIGDKRSVDKMRPLFERRPQAASKLTQLSEGHFVLLQDVTVQEIRREPSMLRTEQLPDAEILGLARGRRPR